MSDPTLTPEQLATAERNRDLIAKLIGEADGLFHFYAIDPATVPTILKDAQAGDFVAVQLAGLYSDMEARATGHPDRRLVCMLCERALGGSEYWVAVAAPMCASRDGYLAVAMCPACATSGISPQRQAIAAFSFFLPDLRPISINATAGHA